MYSSEPLPHFVDDYLQYLRETRPTLACFDGVHVHDDLLEDLSRPAIEADRRQLDRHTLTDGAALRAGTGGGKTQAENEG